MRGPVGGWKGLIGLRDLKGIIVPLLTPLNEEDSFDEHGMKKLVRYLFDNGIHGIFILGSAGEAPCFTFQEREEIIRTTVEEVDGTVPILVGIGRNTTKETLECLKQVEECNLDFAVVIPPLWRPGWVSEDGLIEHYKTLAEESVIPILLYNLPSDAVQISPNIVEELKDVDNIYGIKDSSCNLENILEFSKHMPTFQGYDNEIYPALKLGAAGAISGMANLFPSEVLGIYNAFLKGDYEEAEKLQNKVSTLSDLLFKISPINPLAGEKYCLELMGVCKGCVRRPYVQVTEMEKNNIGVALKEELKIKKV